MMSVSIGGNNGMRSVGVGSKELTIKVENYIIPTLLLSHNV